MKKRFLFTVIIIGIMTVSSVKAQFSIGPGVLYGTKIETFGISANANYDITEKFGAMADYTYFFEKNSVNWWSLDLNGTYTFFKHNVEWYALAGLDLLYYKVKVGTLYTASSSSSYSGVNIGTGWKIKINDKIKLVPEWRYTISNYGYFRFGAKLMFSI